MEWECGEWESARRGMSLKNSDEGRHLDFLVIETVQQVDKLEQGGDG